MSNIPGPDNVGHNLYRMQRDQHDHWIRSVFYGSKLWEVYDRIRIRSCSDFWNIVDSWCYTVRDQI